MALREEHLVGPQTANGHHRVSAGHQKPVGSLDEVRLDDQERVRCALCAAVNLGKKPRGCYCANWQETFRFHEAASRAGYTVRVEAKGHEMAGPGR